MDGGIRHILTLSGGIFCMLGLKTRHIAMMCMSILFNIPDRNIIIRANDTDVGLLIILLTHAHALPTYMV